ncbi:G5 domain-containing protein [Ligilactobacillus agilis]|uniref:G5 domain-containing protein n=1 Tax=Ligilactobacillus agilis TaxID=1601 RepID=UPI00191FC1BC|nr:G5 domain-containing protein [Ligilactobacillus agilis]MBL1055199.1 G5 domain-containing protein [Ligilactobacillus agilis]
MKNKAFFGDKKDRNHLYKTKRGWVVARKSAIVLGATTAVGLSLVTSAKADNVDTTASDEVAIASVTQGKQTSNPSTETVAPTTATSELNNTNGGTSDNASNTTDGTSNATSNVVKDSTSETVSASSNSANTSDTNISNQLVANVATSGAKLATTSLMATSEPTTTSSSTTTEAQPTATQPTLTTAQTDNTQVKPTTSWTSANGDYHVELNKNQISAEDNGLEIKISGTSKAGDKLYVTPQKVDNNYKDIYAKVGIDANQSSRAYSDSVRASISTTALSGNGITSSLTGSYRDDFSGSATFEQNWILTGKGLDDYAPNNQRGYLLRQDLIEATGTRNVLTPIFLEYYDSATKQWEHAVLTYNSLVKNVQPTATLAPVAKNNRGELITDPNKAESNLSAFSGEPFVINIEPNAKLTSNIDGKGVGGNYIKEATYTIPVPDDFKLDVDASFKTSKDDNLSFSQTGNVITVKRNAKADGTLYGTVPNITLVGHIADDKYQGIKQAQAPISISETLVNDEVITKEAGTITYQKNNGEKVGGLPIYYSWDDDSAPGKAGNIMLDNLANQPATKVGSYGFGNTTGLTLNKVGVTSTVADGFNVTNIQAFLYSNQNLKGTATGNYTIHYVDGTTKTGSVQLSTEEKALVDDGTKQIASIEWSIDGLGNLINFSNDLMGNLAHNYRDGSLVKVGDTLKNHYKLYGQYSNNNNGVTNTTFYGGETDQVENVVDSALRVRSGLWTYQNAQGAGNTGMGQISISPGLPTSDADVERVFEPIIYYVLDEGINVNKNIFNAFPPNVTKPKVSKFRLDNGQLVLKLDFTGTGNSFGIRQGATGEYRVNLDIDADAVNGNYYGYGYIDLTNDIKKNPRHKGDVLIDPALAEQLGANALTTINVGKGRYTVNSAQSAYQSNYVKANADNDLTNSGSAYTNQDKSMIYYVNGVNNTNNAMPLTMVVNFPQASADSFKFSLTGPIELDGYTVKYATELSDLNATTPQEHFVEASGISDWSQVKSIELIKNEPLDAHQSTGRLAIHGLDNTLENDAGKTGVFSTVSYFGSLRPFKPEKVSIAVKYDPEYVKTLVDNDRKETPYKTIYQADDSLDVGQKVTKQTGIVDVVSSQTTYTISEDGSSLVPNTTTNHEVVGQDEIILVGVKPKVDKETTPFKTVYRENSNLDHGQQQEVQKGKDTVKTTTTTYELNVETGEVTPHVDSQTDVGQDRIIEIGVKPKVEKETTPFKTIYRENGSLDYGQQNEIQKGKDTVKTTTTTYTLSVETGEVTSHVDSQTDEGQDRIVEIGIKPKVDKETTPFKTIYRENSSLDHGQQQEVQKGKDTVKTTTTTYELNVETGEVTPHVNSETDEGQDRIIEVGIRPVVEKKTTPFKTVYRENSSLDHGQQQEVQKGKDTVKTTTTTYELNVKTGEVTPHVDSQTDEGQDRIIEVGIKPVVEKSTEPYKTIYQADDSLEAGQKVTKQEGMVTTTTKTTTYMLNVETGEVTPKTDTQVDKGQDEIILVGIKPKVEKETTPFKTIYRENNNLDHGQQNEIQKGKDTVKTATTTYELNVETGETTPHVNSETDEGQDRIVEVGIKPVVEKSTDPYKTIYQADDSLEVGQKVTKQSGKVTTTTKTTAYALNVQTGEVTPKTDTQVDKGQDEIILVGVKPKVEKETTPFKTVYRENSSLDHGQQQEVQSGKDTVKTTTTTYELNVETGEVTPHVDSQTDVGQDRIIEVGIKPVVEKSTEPYKTIYQADDSLEAGQKVTKQSGKVTTTTKITTYTLNVQIGEVTPKTDTQVDKGQDEIILVGVKPKVGKKTTPYKTVYRENTDLDHGQTHQVQSGKDTTKTTTTTYELNLVDGSVNSKTSIAVDAGQDRIIEVGIKPVTTTDVTPFKIVYRTNGQLTPGQIRVIQVGKDTTVVTTTTYKLNLTDGSVASKTTKTTDQGQDQIVEVGIAPKSNKNVKPFETVYVPDETLEAGKQVVDQVGKNTTTITTTTYTLDENHQLVPHTQTSTVEGQNQIVRVGIKPVTKVDTKGYQTTYVENKDLPAGKQVTKQDGKTTVTTSVTTYTLNTKTGEVTPHGKTNTSLGQDKIVEVGTKPVVVVTKTPNETKYQPNYDLDYGKRNQIQVGKDTVTTTTTNYRLDKQTGKVTSTTDTKVTNGQDEIIEVGLKPVTVVETTGFKVIYVADESLEAGKQVIDQEGKVTTKTATTTYALNTKTGEVTSHTDSKLDEGQDKIVRVGIKPVVTEKHTDYKVIYVPDENLEVGKKITIQTGKKGSTKTTTTYEMDKANGKVTDTTHTDTTKAQDEIIHVGIKPVVEKTTEPYKTVYQADDSLEAGKKVVVQEGKDTTTTKTTTNKLNESTGEVTSTTDTQVDQGQDKIVKVGIKPVVVRAETPYQTEYVEDKNLDEGQTKLIQPGKNTLVVTTTTYTLLADGSVQANTPVEDKTIGQNEIIAVGMKQEAKPVTPTKETKATPHVEVVPTKHQVTIPTDNQSPVANSSVSRGTTELPQTGEHASTNNLFTTGLLSILSGLFVAGFGLTSRKKKD